MNGTIENQNQRPVQDVKGDLIILPQRKVGVFKISQREILKFLKKNKSQWFTALQLSKETGIGINSCTNNIIKLIKYKLIKRREAAKKCTYEYSYLHQESMIRKRPLKPKELKEVCGE